VQVSLNFEITAGVNPGEPLASGAGAEQSSAFSRCCDSTDRRASPCASQRMFGLRESHPRYELSRSVRYRAP
jgi:hypothetical protein